MSFAIRPTYKTRSIVSLDPENDGEISHNPEDSEEIISKIRQFTTRSSHENVLSSQDFKEILRNSSINPDINPLAKKSVDEVMKRKEANSKGVSNYVNPTDVGNTHGFSTNSADNFYTGVRSAKMEKELKREIDAIRIAKKTKDAENDRDIPDDIAKQISAMRGDVEPDDSESIDEPENDDDLSAASESKLKRIELAKAKRVLSYSHPARASMVRGFVPRTGGSGGGMGVRKTALGMSDSF